MTQTPVARKQWDCKACVISLVVAFAVAVPAGLAATRIADSLGLLTAVITLVGTSVSRWTYARVARRDARPIEDESCGTGGRGIGIRDPRSAIRDED